MVYSNVPSSGRISTVEIIHLLHDPSEKGGMGLAVRKLVEAQIRDGATRVRLIATTSSRRVPHKYVGFGIAILRVVWACIKRPKPILHLHCAAEGSFTRKALLVRIAKLFGVVTVFEQHTNLFDVWYNSCSETKQRWIRRQFARPDYVIVVSDFLLRFVRGLGVRRVTTVHRTEYEIDRMFEIRRPKPSSDSSLQILYIGMLTKEKGACDLLAAAARIAGTHPKVTFLMCGDHGVEEARRRAEELGLSDVVELPGRVSRARKLEALTSSQIFVLPARVEGQPLAIYEAMASGLPVVACRLDELTDLIKDQRDGLLVAPGDIDALTQAITRLADDPDLRWKLGMSARRTFARRLATQPSPCDRTMQVYQRVLPRPRKGGGPNRGAASGRSLRPQRQCRQPSRARPQPPTRCGSEVATPGACRT
jgi:glycosyltransferase involved in cell wall biosynthesis